MIKLSVIIPIYNTPHNLLEHCLTSVKENISNMDDEVEVLLINDGSTELYIEEVLKATEKQDESFKYIFKLNGGVSDARNVGIGLAQGEYISFLDPDDFLEPDALQYMLNVIQEKNADMVTFGFCYDNEKVCGKTFNAWVSGNDKEKAILSLISNDMTKWYDYGVNLASACMKLYRRSALIQNKIFFKTELATDEDGFFNLCLLNTIEKFYIDNRLVYHYVTSTNSKTHGFSDLAVNAAGILLKDLDDFVRHNIASSHASSLVAYRAFKFIRAAKDLYFTHPLNTQSFWELKSQLNAFLSTPIIKESVNQLPLSFAKNKIDLKNIVLLKLHLYWVFLLTERRKRKRHI